MKTIYILLGLIIILSGCATLENDITCPSGEFMQSLETFDNGFRLVCSPVNETMLNTSQQNFTEIDTLQSVTDRGSVTTNGITVGGESLFEDNIRITGNLGIKRSPTSGVSIHTGNGEKAYFGGTPIPNTAFHFETPRSSDFPLDGNQATRIVRFMESGGQNPTFDLASFGSTFYFHNGRADLGNIAFSTRRSLSNDVRLMILNNGNVGIGTTSPTAKLHVNGNFQTTSNVIAQGSIQANTYKSADGSIGWTGSCSGTLEVKNGLVVGCS